MAVRVELVGLFKKQVFHIIAPHYGMITLNGGGGGLYGYVTSPLKRWNIMRTNPKTSVLDFGQKFCQGSRHHQSACIKFGNHIKGHLSAEHNPVIKPLLWQ